MGHKRVGYLPKSQKWRDIVAQISSFDGTADSTADVVQRTTEGVRRDFARLDNDPTLAEAFRFFTALAVAAREPNPAVKLASVGIEVGSAPTPLTLARALRERMPRPDSVEHASLIEQAAIETIGVWTRRTDDRAQGKLFDVDPDPFRPWQKASTGAGFCELARVFLGRVTERYLNYFLDREASAAIPDPIRRERFAGSVSTHVDEVSRHAFETAKIAQSFAAGWFNKYASNDIPSSTAVRGFLRHAVGKLREELRQEARR